MEVKLNFNNLLVHIKYGQKLSGGKQLSLKQFMKRQDSDQNSGKIP